MPQSKKLLITCYAIGIYSISFLFFSSNCLAATAYEAWPARDPISIHIQDTDTFLAIKLKTKKLNKKASPHRLKNRTVEIGKNATATLGNIAKVVFSKQNVFRNNITNLPVGSRGVLHQRPIIKDWMYDFEDSFVLVQSTSIIVQDPAELAKVSPQFRSFLGNEKPGRIDLSQLNRESRLKLNTFITKELPRLPQTHPLRAAAKGKTGDNLKIAVLRAIAEGKGLFETVEEVIIPKKMPPIINGKVMHPSFRNGMFDYSQLRPSKFKLPETVRLPRSIRAISSDQQETSSRHSIRMVKEFRGNMIKPFEATFLTGFTFANNWEWSRTWKFRSGLFRIQMGAGYTFGLRIPIKVTGHSKPTWIRTRGRNDKPSTWETHLSVKPINGTLDDFENAEFVFNGDTMTGAPGKELAFEFGVGYGYKVRALWTTVKNVKYHMLAGKDLSEDFRPPYDTSPHIDIWIPPGATNTFIDVGVVRGELKFGVRLSGQGKVSLGYDSFHGRTHNRRSRTFYNPKTVILKNTIAPMTLSAGQNSRTERYGFTLSNPVYKVRPIITPGVNFSIRVGYRWVKKRYAATIWVGALKVTMPYQTLTKHDDTKGSHRFDVGEKTFATPEADQGFDGLSH